MKQDNKSFFIVQVFAEVFFYTFRVNKRGAQAEVQYMKGYLVGSGFMGLVGDSYMLFSSEEEYEEYLFGD